MPAIETIINDEQEQAIKRRIGERISLDFQPWEAMEARVSRSTIRTWAVLNGDMRPLYMDPEYAAKSRWERIIAPPACMMAYEQIVPEIDCALGSLPVLHSARLEFAHPIRMNDVIMAASEIKGVEDVSRKGLAGRIVSARIATEVWLENGDPVGSLLLDWHLYERGSDAQRALFEGREIHNWEQADIEALKAEYAQETQRGSTPLYWEDAGEGDELNCVLKGPTTKHRHISRMKEAWYWGHKQGWDEYQERPALFFRNENNAPEPIAATDWDHHRARRWGGLPGALEANTDRPHHLVHMLANWSGDWGYPKLLDLQFPKQDLIGDVCRSHGRVTGKRREGDAGIVLLDVWQVNQRGETITTGKAEFQLPLK